MLNYFLKGHELNQVYIVAANRTAFIKANKGLFANTRPDELLAQLIKKTLEKTDINKDDIEDVIIGCAFPEAEQGLNIARISLLLAGIPNHVSGITINRYCSSGLNAISIAANRIQIGECDVVIAGGVESMSMIPMGGNKFSVSPEIFDIDVAISYGMGLTAENVAKQWNISRTSQDSFSYESHKKAEKAQNNGEFDDEIIPITVKKSTPNLETHQIIESELLVTTDDGVRYDTTLESLAKLQSPFATDGSITAGNSSQITDGAGCLILVSEKYLKQHNLIPLAKFIGFAVKGVEPSIMGIGPIKSIPAVLSKTGLSLGDIDLIELNEAFAAQSLAVIHELDINKSIVNINGGAIALGHPLGATGAMLSAKIIHALRKRKEKYGIVSMCIGAGMGAAGIFEAVY